jgi:hypothetical protein
MLYLKYSIHSIGLSECDAAILVMSRPCEVADKMD